MSKDLITRTNSGLIFYNDRTSDFEWEPFAPRDIPTTGQWQMWLAARTTVGDEKFASPGRHVKIGSGHKIERSGGKHVRWTGRHPIVCALCSKVTPFFEADPIRLSSQVRFREYVKDGEFRGQALKIFTWKIVTVVKQCAGCTQCQREVMVTMHAGGRGHLDVTPLVTAEVKDNREHQEERS